MSGEFNSFCSRYYRLTQRLEKEQAYLKKFLDNAPLYQGETELSKIDNIIRYYRKTQDVKAAVDETMDALNDTAKNILKIMKYFDIPPRTVLHGMIEGETEFDVWADETEQVYIMKGPDLTLSLPPNVIRIKFSNDEPTIFDDEDEWFPK